MSGSDFGRCEQRFALTMQSPMAVDRVDSLSDYYTTMRDDEIEKQVWLTQTDATFQDLYKGSKIGIHSLAQAAPELDESNREWQIEIKGVFHAVPAFQSCMYEKGLHVVGRHHALPGSTHKSFRGFKAITGDLLRWIDPDESDEKHACFLEAMRQAAMAYLFFLTAKYTEHMVRTSNVIQHQFAVAKDAYAPGAPTQNGKTISLIWQTRWMREAISITARIAYAETGVPPTLDNLTGASSQVVFTMSNYVKESNAYTQSMTRGKRSNVLDAGSMHRVDLSLGLSPDDNNKQKKGGEADLSPDASYTKYNGLNTSPAIQLLHARDSKLATLVSKPPCDMPEPLNHFNVVSRKLFETTSVEREGQRDVRVLMREGDTSLEKALLDLSTSIKPLYHPNVATKKMFDNLTEQVREAAERETELLRISNLLSATTEEVEQTKRQLSTATDCTELQQKELDALKVAYEEMCQLKATTDYEKSAAISERDAAMREKKQSDEQVHKGLKAMSALESKMAAETKIMTSKFDELTKKEWKAPTEVTKLNATISAQEKIIKTLKSQNDLKEKQEKIPGMLAEISDLKSQLAMHSTNKNTTNEEKEEFRQMENELAQLKEDYSTIEAGADESLEEFSNEMMAMVQQVSTLQDLINEQEKEIKELQTVKPRGLSRALAAVQSVPAESKPKEVTEAAPAQAASAPPLHAPTPAEENSSASIPSDYVYQAKCPEDESQSEYIELAITEVADQLMASRKQMADNITDQKARLKLGSKKMTDEQKINASKQYDEEMSHNVELWHACMGDHGQKYIAFGHKRPKGPQSGKPKMNCAGCGRVQGDWNMIHNRADRHTNSRTCPAKGTVCKTCDKYHLTDQAGSERYSMHTEDACPLNNSVAFCKKIAADLLEKHSSQELGASNNTSAWS